MRRLALTSVHSESAGGCDTGEKIEASAGTLADHPKVSRKPITRARQMMAPPTALEPLGDPDGAGTTTAAT
jgi:hypothetical protein